MKRKTESQILTYEMGTGIFLLSTLFFKHGTYSLELLEHIRNLIDSLFSNDGRLNYERKITQKLIKFFKVVYHARVIKKAAQLSTELVMISLLQTDTVLGKKRVKMKSSTSAGIADFCLQTMLYSSFTLPLF